MLKDRMHLWIVGFMRGLDLVDIRDGQWTEMRDVESIAPGLRFLDIQTEPVMQNTYTNDPAVDGSRFEYSTYQKSTVTLKFWLTFDNYADFIDKKHDVERYFAQKAGFAIATSYRPWIHAFCYFNSFENFEPTNNSAHTCLFNVKLDNAWGCWYSETSSNLIKHWSTSIKEDLQLPVRMGDPNWELHPGENHVYIPGDTMIQMSNPQVMCHIEMADCSGSVLITNEDTGTELSASGDGIAGNLIWRGLDLRNMDDNTPLNQYSSSADFWLNPGWNTISVSGCSNAFIDTQFIFVTI